VRSTDAIRPSVVVVGGGFAGVGCARELGKHRVAVTLLDRNNYHQFQPHGHVAFAAWLGVHAWLMSGVHQRVDAVLSWAWDFFGSSRSTSILDDPEKARIDWGDDDAVAATTASNN
jgi:NADH dehydrogenase FAD-containing subunit